MAKGRISPPFSEVHMMTVYGWTWDELMAIPIDVIERLTLYTNVRHVIDHGGELDFEDAK